MLLNLVTKGLTIGFEQETYTISEPTGVQTIQSVCMVILQGTLGRNLTVRPITNDGTATSNIIIVHLLCIPILQCFTYTHKHIPKALNAQNRMKRA